MRALLLIDHGSRRAEANRQLDEMVSLLRTECDGALIVEAAHMELSAPSIADGFARCVERGADEVIAVPYFLSAGRHVTDDIPRLVADAAAEHPGVRFEVATALGPDRMLARLALVRAGILEPDG